jgi:cysteinyl-tRNA synthetase
MPLRLYNTLTKKVEEFRPADPAHVTFYTCGPTVYDDAHIGNFRSFLAADLLRRFVESPLCELVNETSAQADDRRTHGRRVTHVMNITDVGHMTDDTDADGGGLDKMAVAGQRIAEAKKAGKLPPGAEIDPRDPYQIARFYEGRFKEDARRLGLKVAIEAEKDATLMPRATEHVRGMIAVIARLVERGFAYVVGAPGSRVVYFDVRQFPSYGALSGNTLDNLKEGEGGRVSASNQAGKRNPADFLLWKEDASHIMKWESPWGAGYPGWHIECTAMSLERLVGGDGASHLPGMTQGSAALIDLHSGGEDNIFPHHECEIAQSCGAFNAQPEGAPFASMWFHPRFLLVEGTKMSKSKGNFFTARELFASPPAGKGIEPAALRLELIKTHYRSNANFTMQGLSDSQRMVERLRRFAEVAAANTTPTVHAATQICRERLAHALHDDLNIALALAEVNTWMNAVERPGGAEAALLRDIDAVLGVLSLERPAAAIATDIGVFAPGLTPDPQVEALLRQRRDARAAKDFKASDAIRDQLAALGYAIKDMAGGKVEVRRA